MQQRTRTVAYLRVSTDKQVEHGLSLEAQQGKVNAYAELYDLELVAVEVDAGVSAKTLQRPALQRPALQRALSLLKSGKAEALLIVKLDRLTRSVKDLGELIGTYFGNGKWALMSVSEQLDTRSAAGRLVLNILGSVAQWERETIGERTAEAMAYKKAQREYTGGEPPYGWQVDSDGIHLVPSEHEQPVIRVAVELKAAGLSLRKIGERLSSRGFLPRRGHTWHPQTVKELLHAEGV